MYCSFTKAHFAFPGGKCYPVCPLISLSTGFAGVFLANARCVAIPVQSIALDDEEKYSIF